MKTTTLLLIIISFFTTTISTAQTHTWTGNGGDTNWFTASNWDINTVPSMSSDVFIPDGYVVEIATSNTSVNTLELEGSAELFIRNNLTVIDEVLISAVATFHFEEGVITGGGTITNWGVFLIETNAVNKELTNITITNHSKIRIVESGSIKVKTDLVINNEPTGDIEILSTGGFLNQATNALINNYGSIRKVPDGNNPIGGFYLVININNWGIIETAIDQTFLILTSPVTLHNYPSGKIQGDGVYDITANFINEGVFAPGTEGTVGSFDVVNNFSFPEEATLKIDINGSEEGEYDSIDITGSTALEGNIEITILSELNFDDTFTILTANTITNCNLPDTIIASHGGFEIYVFEVTCSANSVDLRLDIIVLNTPDFSSETTAFYVQPNPVKDVSNIVVKPSDGVKFSSESTSFALYTVEGQKVKTIASFSEENNRFNRENLASGLYFLQLISDEKVVATTKIVVE